MTDIFRRSNKNPILTPSKWWEGRGVLNPGACFLDGSVALVYRAVGMDSISRFGLATSHDGETFSREELPFYESRLDDEYARLGVEDPRITPLEGKFFLTYTKASVEHADQRLANWEPAPFRVRSAIGESDNLTRMREISVVAPGVNTKDMVLFPQKVGNDYVALIREFPNIQLILSSDLLTWSEPVTVLSPVPNSWQGERIGAGPPPVPTQFGWLLFYHANEFIDLKTNRRLYRMGLAVLDLLNPSRVVYRHPEPVFEPSASYEREGPVGNVVFGTGLLERDDEYWLYYGAGDGLVGLATASRSDIERLLPRSVRESSTESVSE